ncbi:TPA: restriction endonuclease subunit S [Enterococcus faecalis]|uniref:restriction endonuclease subunit S n=1 Tax=Enterococcus sp. E4-220 TaxID=3002970 RepID=UPI0019F2E58C|nr:restriction endonuclease subunit S [Enterococcus sp. E4-220]EGP4838975.1 restriction endonuclease subunit S [Enterococcus faecium]MEB4775143.1 restriction endonuclease subunit S [Enterococcus sp. E4-220]HAP5355585.1 restriction endonuclease subunit S [Enterococcus faecalis]
MSNDAQPEIRFPGFTDDWEQRKLGEVADIIGGGTPNTNNPEYWNGDIDWYAPAEIGKQIYVKNSQKKISQLGLQKSSAKILPIGTVLFTSRAGIGNTAILAKEGTTNQGFQSIVPHENKLDSYFIFSRTHELKRYGEVTGAGSTFAEVSGKQMAKMPILIPYIDEQQKIGIFFKKLDDTITLHQRTLDLLKETKKGFLQKMFPKNGAKVPEIRFPGFTEDWEQRKVGDFLNESRIKGSDGSVARKMTVKLWRKGVVPKEEIYSGSSATQYYIRKSGQFMYGKLDFLNQAFGIVPSELDGYESTLDSPAFDIGENMNSIFLLEYVSLTRFYKYQGNLANGSRRAKRIHVDTFLEMPIPTPSFEEQTKIGGFFKQLDDTITLHQRKLDLLKETKKGFLQKMFV